MNPPSRYFQELTQPEIAAQLRRNPLVVLPAGSRIKGVVLQARPAARLHHNGQLRIAVSPDCPAEWSCAKNSGQPGKCSGRQR